MSVRERTRSLPEQMLDRNNREANKLVTEPPVKRFLPTGCSVLNCAVSDRVDGGWPSGKVSNLIGDSDTSKTVLGMHALAEACQRPEFDDYLLIYSDIEEALTPGAKAMFGKKVQERAIFLNSSHEDKELHPPQTIEEFHYQLLDLIKGGTPFVYVLDSLDFLPSQADLNKSQEQKTAWEKGKESAGSYQMYRQKYLKQLLREIKGGLSKTDSILIIISQTIANIGPGFDPKTVAGGFALEYASRVRFWLSKMEADKVGKDTIGRKLKVKVSKNHITGKLREVQMWVYTGLGIDDIKTSINFLLSEGAWGKAGGYIIPTNLIPGDQKFHISDLIQKIEKDKLQDKLNKLVQRKWDQRENGLKLNREPRYK